MTDLTAEGSVPAQARPRSPDLYRAVWRWHFFAGLFVLPFLVTLSVTGALYLFRDELDALIHHDLKRIEIAQGMPKADAGTLVWTALAAHPGTAVRYVDPPRADSSAEITVANLAGERLTVYVDPYRNTVLGTLPDRGTVMWTVRYLHSLRYFGSVARGMVEIAAGWTVLLVGTGLFLWWPRGQRGGVVTVRGAPRSRVFWRDLHAVAGLVLGGFIVFLAVTGMPWSQVWGGAVNDWANGRNFGYPSGVRVAVPSSGAKLSDTTETAWTLQEAELPVSAAATASPIGIDEAAGRIRDLGLAPGWALSLPTDSEGVYSASVYPDRASGQRVVHLDQYTGEALVDVGFDGYGPAARWLEWGISVHLGQEYGRLNQIVLLLVCIGNVLLAVSAAVMWWKRRPARSLGVPPLPRERGVLRGLVAILALGGLLFPLVGLSLIVMLALDWTAQRFQRG